MKRLQQYLDRLCNGRRKSRRRGASALALQPHRTIGMESLETRAMLAVVLPNLPAGSQYQLAFVTASSRTAESASIDFYNAFANAQASQSSELPAATWSAVVSTPTVDALSNAIAYPAIPIYNTRGELIASGAAVWWSTQHYAAIAYDQWGTKNSTNFEWVWTGSNPDGSRANALGSSQFMGSTVGVSYGLDVRWASDNTRSNQFALPVYALSSVVTAAGANGTPSAVTGLSCVAGDAQVVLNWTAPSSNGGRVVTDYLVQVSSNGGTSWTTFSDGTSTASTATVTGLTNGTAYIFRVAAVNAFGAGAYSAASAAVIPATTPSAPTLLAATSGVGKVTLSWTAPVSNGGSGVTDYRVEYSSNGGTSWTAFNRSPSTELTATVTGLSNYVAYVFRVRATNSAGSGTYSLPSDSVEPASPEADFDTAILNGVVAITNYKGPGGDVFIPQRINGAKVEALASGLSFPTSVNSVTIPKSVSVIEFSAGRMFANVSTIVVDSGHATYRTIDGILYNKDVTSLIQCPGRKSGRVVIPSSVKDLGNWGFAYCASMTDVVIPQGVAGIGWGTFYGCSQLASVSIPTSVGRIDTLAFARCKSLAAVSLPAGVTFIGGQAFQGCTSLAGVVIPDAVLTIGASAFSDCVGLVSVSLPRGITAIAQGTFLNCTSLPAITIPDSVTSLGSSAFANCSALTVVICEGNAPAVMGAPFGGVPAGTVFYFAGRTGWGPTLGGLPTKLAADAAQTKAFAFADENTIKSDWILQGSWRVEGNGLRLLDINASLTSKQAYDSTLQKHVFSYDITPNTQMWLSIWGETLSFEVPSSSVGSVVATIQRQGDTITFDSGTGTSTVVQIKQANLATATPIVLRMDQRNLYRPTMQLLLKSAQVTTLPAPSLSVPSAPTGVGGTSGDGQASISWTAPSSNGNAGVTDYLIQFSSNSGSTWTTFSDGISTATSATIAGLTNGATYIFRVAAVNAVGAGAYSPASLAVTPATTPSAPTGVSATSGNGQASVSWLAPTSNGGNAITDYVVQFSSNGGTTWTTFNDGASTVTAAIITSLTNGTAYVFRIAAANAVGIGAYSIASSAVTPATNPAAPTNVIATAGNGQTSISWTAPISNGGSAITDYLVQFRSTSGTTWTTFNDGISTGTAATVTGLTNGTAYVFRIAAANAVGTGAYSTASVAVTPATTPSAPTGVIATASNGQVRLSWTPPSSNGGTAVTDYVISFATNRFPFPMTTVIDGTSTATSATITGLTNGTTYVFWVAAVNAVGTGSYSTASSAVTPATTPSAPTGVVVTAGNGQADVFWTFPTSNGGSFITDYVIQYSSNGGSTWRTFSDGTSNLERATITGLTNGTAYMFRVAAVNAAGTSAYSSPPGEAVVYVAPGEVMVETGTYLGPQGRRKQGAGTLIVTGSHMNSGATVVEEGQIVVRDTMALGLGALDIKAGAKVVFETGTDLIRLAALTIDSGGLLDVGTTGFVLPDDVATAASVRQLLVAGMTSNAFGVKSGITSHFAGTGHYRVGYSNDSGDLVTRLAIAGDTNLDGRQDVLDVSSMMAAGLYDTGVPASWGEGDFNFDGVFDILDMTSFLGSGRFDTGNYRGTWQVAMSLESQLAPDAVIVALAVTVEPQSRVGKRGRMLF